MNNIIVTGGAGFIGSHLTGRLVREGYKVTVIDNLSTGKLEKIEDLISDKKIEFVQGSITELPLLQKVLHSADTVFHLAAIASVPRSIDDPVTSHEVNATGTLNVLIAARDNGIDKVVFSSSSSVYGDTPVMPKEESMFPEPLSPYAVSKLTGEYYCQVFSQVYGLATACLRYFNVFGPGQDPNSQYAAVIPKFITSCLIGQPPVIFGDGEQTRDFTFVADVVQANLMAADDKVRGVYNISRGESITINRLADLIIELTESSTKPIHKEPRPGDIMHSLADISRALSFGYKTKYDLKTGLAETVKSFKN